MGFIIVLHLGSSRHNPFRVIFRPPNTWLRLLILSNHIFQLTKGVLGFYSSTSLKKWVKIVRVRVPNINEAARQMEWISIVLWLSKAHALSFHLAFLPLVQGFIVPQKLSSKLQRLSWVFLNHKNENEKENANIQNCFSTFRFSLGLWKALCLGN